MNYLGKTFILCLTLFDGVMQTNAGLEINETAFPDENFRSWVLAQPYGADGVLTDEEIECVWEMHVNKRDIQNIKGIEFFTELRVLYCSALQLTELDVSKCTKLEVLQCDWNQLDELDVSGNVALKELACNGNELTRLDLSNNVGLTEFFCNNNHLTDLDVSKNKALTSFNCKDNELTVLNVTENVKLNRLVCSDNHLTTLDVSACPELTSLKCAGNRLSMLDVSGCSALEEVYCYSNQIRGEAMDALIDGLPINPGRWGHLPVISLDDEQNIMTKVQVAAAKAKGWIPRYRYGSFGTYGWTEYEGSDPIALVTFTTDQMATIILPTEPDASKGKYYRLAGCRDGEIVFEQELQPRAHVPYIIVPSEDFSINPAELELAGLTGDTVSVEGVRFIGTYKSGVLPSLGGDGGGFYYDIIDQTSDCSLSPSGETGMQAVVGALRAYLLVDWRTAGWNDPYTQGGTKDPWQKMPIVLRDDATPIAGCPQMVNGESSNGKCYDLQGRRISEKPSHGIYIEGGKVKARP